MVDDTAHAPMGFLGFRRGAVLFSRAPAAMVVAPILLYPFSRLIWLGFDLMLRPAVPNDVASPTDRH
jgi:hypothetical protein